MRKLSITIVGFFLMASCTAYRAQHGLDRAASEAPPVEVSSTESSSTAPSATAGEAIPGNVQPSHDAHAMAPPPANSSRPTAERTLVARFAQMPLDIKQATIQAQLDALKTDLAAQGNYSCCVKPSCNECAINAGECHCSRVVQLNGPCCGECTQAWIEGRGIVEGVDVEQVLEHLGCVRELYEKKLPPGETMPGTRKP